MHMKAAHGERPRLSYPLSGVLRRATLSLEIVLWAVAEPSDLTFMIERIRRQIVAFARPLSRHAHDQKGELTWQYLPPTGAA
jgi:hypothetical protein